MKTPSSEAELKSCEAIFVRVAVEKMSNVLEGCLGGFYLQESVASVRLLFPRGLCGAGDAERGGSSGLLNIIFLVPARRLVPPWYGPSGGFLSGESKSALFASGDGFFAPDVPNARRSHSPSLTNPPEASGPLATHKKQLDGRHLKLESAIFNHVFFILVFQGGWCCSLCRDDHSTTGKIGGCFRV